MGSEDQHNQEEQDARSKLLDRSPLRATSEGESPLAQQRGRSGPERGTYNINKKGGHLLLPEHSNVTLRKVAAV